MIEGRRGQKRFTILWLALSLVLLLLTPNAHAWLLVDEDDDPDNPRLLRSDTPVTVKTSHFNVINYVDTERGPTECNMAPYPWPAGLEAEFDDGNSVNADHINAVRAAIRQMYRDAYGPLWVCTDQFPSGSPGGTLCETAVAGDPIRREHVNDIRHSFGGGFNTPGVCDLFPMHPTACGNGNINIGETCDDTNHVDGDGCSATCQCEFTWVNETCGGPTNTECPMSQMYQNGTSTWGACVPTTRCVADAGCEWAGFVIEFDLEPTAVCALEPDTYTVTGKVVSALEPVRVIRHTYIDKPEDLHPAEYEYIDMGIFNTGDTFSYEVNWPGVREGDDVVALFTGVHMRTADDDTFIEGANDGLEFYWGEWVCDAICECGEWTDWGCGDDGKCEPNEMRQGRECDNGYRYTSCQEKRCLGPEESPTCA